MTKQYNFNSGDNLNDDRLKENCGVFAAYDLTKKRRVESIVLRGLKFLQHRGGDAAGIAGLDFDRSKQERPTIERYRAQGKIAEAFPKNKREEILARVGGQAVIGHVRYRTTGNMTEAYIQPRVHGHPRPWKCFTFAFNGNVANHDLLREGFLKSGLEDDEQITTVTKGDYEVLKALIVEFQNGETRKPVEDLIRYIQDKIDGSLSMVFMRGNGEFVAYRDKHGFMPLCYTIKNDILMVASESVALKDYGTPIYDIVPSEMLYIDKNQQHILKKLYSAKISRCIFQIAYFAEVESILDGLPVYQSRLAMGQALACILKSKYPNIKMDSSIAVPESSNPIAEGFAEEYDIPNRQGIRRRRHIDRSFIDSDPSGVLDEKFGIIDSELNGKNIVLIEDSIVRGNTLGKKLIKKIKAESSPASIHVCIGFPPVQAPCFYGIDMSTLGQLMVTDYQKRYGNIYMENKELDPNFEKWCAEKLEVDSVTFLTTDRYLKAIGIEKDESCTACCTAEYPTPYGKQKYKELAGKFYDK